MTTPDTKALVERARDHADEYERFGATMAAADIRALADRLEALSQPSLEEGLGVSQDLSQTADVALEGTRRVLRLKTWPEPFAAIRAGLKSWELRKNDRDYRVGDLLALEEWNPDTGMYTGQVTGAVVTWILHGGQFGLPGGYVIMSLDLGALSSATQTDSDKSRDAKQPSTPQPSPAPAGPGWRLVPIEPFAEAFSEIVQWSEAYPTDIFPEPDLIRARVALEAAGMTLDAVSASNMRHVISRVRSIIEPLQAMLPAAPARGEPVSYTHLTLPTNREV